jgi:ribosomal protein L31
MKIQECLSVLDENNMNMAEMHVLYVGRQECKVSEHRIDRFNASAIADIRGNAA